MSNNWTELAINTTTIVGELLSEFFQEHGAKGVVLGEWQPEQISEYTTVKAYFPEDIENVSELIEKTHNKLDEYYNSGLNVGAKEISIKLIKEEDWANSWKKYFHVLHVGKNLVVKPSWEEYQPMENELVVNFDPGMAFGTGTHPSTQLCMEELEEMAANYHNKVKILDVGTGSGILAITLKLLGFNDITAIDNDIVAIKASEENFRFNDLTINLFQGEIKNTEGNYDLIVGNLLADIIISIASEISEKLKSGGIYIGSGIIRERENDVTYALTQAGLKLTKQKYLEHWVMLVFSKA